MWHEYMWEDTDFVFEPWGPSSPLDVVGVTRLWGLVAERALRWALWWHPLESLHIRRARW